MSDVNIPQLKLHSGQTLLVLDESINILIPDSGNQKVTFQILEFPILEGTVIENVVKRQSSVKVCLKKDKGHVLRKGKKSAVEELFLEFSQKQDCKDFTEAFARQYERLEQASRSQAAVQQSSGSQQQPPKMSIAVLNLESELGTDNEAEDASNVVSEQPNPHSGGHQQPAGVPANQQRPEPVPSPDIIVGQAGPSSDVFGPDNSHAKQKAHLRGDGVQGRRQNRPDRHSIGGGNSRKSATAAVDAAVGAGPYLGTGVPPGLLKGKFVASKAQDMLSASVSTTGVLPSDQTGYQATSSSSPLARPGKHKQDQLPGSEEGTTRHRGFHVRTHDPALTQSLDDQDFALFKNTGSEPDGLMRENVRKPLQQRGQSSLNERLKTKAGGKLTTATRGQNQISTDSGVSNTAGRMVPPREATNVPQGTSAHPRTSSTSLKPPTKGHSQRAANAGGTSAKGGTKVQSKPSFTTNTSGEKIKKKAQRPDGVNDGDKEIYDLAAESEEADTQILNPTSKKLPNSRASKKALKGSTKTDRRPDSRTGATKKVSTSKLGKTKAVPALKSEPPAPTRRSQRAVARKPAKYQDPSGSEVDEEEVSQEELEDIGTADDQENGDDSGKRRWASQAKQQRAASKKGAVPSKNVAATTSAEQASQAHRGPVRSAEGMGRRGGTTKHKGASASDGIIVPSSDPATESEDTRLAQPMQQQIDATSAQTEHDAGTQLEEQMVAQDSYPKDTEARRSDGGADRSFGSKLRSLAMTTPLPQAGSNHKQNGTPFGDAKAFVQNVNGARGSVSAFKKLPAKASMRSNKKPEEETDHLDDGQTQHLEDDSSKQLTVVQTSEQEDMAPLVAVQDDVALSEDNAGTFDAQDDQEATSQVDKIHAATSGPIQELEDGPEPDLTQQNNDNVQDAVAGQPFSDVGHEHSLGATSEDHEELGKQGTAKSVEIADSQDKGAIDYSIVAPELATMEAVSAAAVSTTTVQTAPVQETVLTEPEQQELAQKKSDENEPVRQDVQRLDPVHYPKHEHDKQESQQPATIMSTRVEAEPTTTADNFTASRDERPAHIIQSRLEAIQPPADQAPEVQHTSAAITATTKEVLKLSRKSNLIHFGSAGPQNQGSPSKAEAAAVARKMPSPSQDTASPTKATGPSGMAKHSGTGDLTDVEAIEEGHSDSMLDASDVEINEEPSRSKSGKVIMQEAEVLTRINTRTRTDAQSPQMPDNLHEKVKPTKQQAELLPHSEASTKIDSSHLTVVDTVRKQGESVAQQAVPLTGVKDLKANDAAFVSGNKHARASEPNAQPRHHEANKDTRRASAPQPAQLPQQNILQAHKVGIEAATDVMKPPIQPSPKKRGVVSTNSVASQAQVDVLTEAIHTSDDYQSSKLNVTKKRDHTERRSGHAHGERSDSVAEDDATVAHQDSPRKADQVPTRRVGQFNKLSITMEKAHVLVPAITTNDIPVIHGNEGILAFRNTSMTNTGNGAQALAPASPKALASEERATLQGRIDDTNDHHNSSPSAQAAFSRPVPHDPHPHHQRSALVQQQESAQPGNSQESPVNISSTDLVSDQDSESQSEQESEFEASVLDELPLPSDSRPRTRRVTARSQQAVASPSGSEESEEEESPPAKRRKTTKVQEMAQTMVRRPQAPDDISQFVQRQFPQAQSTISFTKMQQTGRPPALPFKLDATNVFGARDLSQASHMSSHLHGFQLHGAQVAPQTPLNQVSTVNQGMPTRKVQSPKKTNMPPPARPAPKNVQPSEPTHKPSLNKASKKENTRQTEAPTHDHNRSTSNIKRLRQVISSPVKPSQTAAPACTPQPFHERLHAATSPVSDAGSSFSGPDTRRISHNHVDTGDTTLVEPYFLLGNTMPQSPTALSTARGSEFSASPEPESRTTRLNDAHRGSVFGTGPATEIQQSLQQTMLSTTQVCILVM